MIRVLLVDDHQLMRQGTRALLSSADDIEIVAETDRGEPVLDLAKQYHPDVVVLDIRLGGLSVVEVARQLRERLPETRILILTAYDHDQYVRALFAIGVDGYLLKYASGDELITAVRDVVAGKQVQSPEIEARRRNVGLPRSELLSDREIEILTLVSRGESNKEIARALGINSRTAEWHVSNVLAKLGARCSHAIRCAGQQGISEMSE